MDMYKRSLIKQHNQFNKQYNVFYDYACTSSIYTNQNFEYKTTNLSLKFWEE